MPISYKILVVRNNPKSVHFSILILVGVPLHIEQKLFSFEGVWQRLSYRCCVQTITSRLVMQIQNPGVEFFGFFHFGVVQMQLDLIHVHTLVEGVLRAYFEVNGVVFESRGLLFVIQSVCVYTRWFVRFW